MPSEDFEFDFETPPEEPRGFTFLDLDAEPTPATKVDDRWDPSTPGTRFADYEVTGRLGQGAMGLVLEGRDTRNGRPVAIKVLHARLGRIPKAVERFRREAVAVWKVRHEHIIEVFLYGILRGRPFMVLELLRGGSVMDLIERSRRERRPVPVARAVDLIDMTLAALEAAHGKGLLHRDIKPDNLLLDRSGRVKLADFGLVKLREQTGDASMTVTGTSMGTPLYMPPEQFADAKSVDARGDLYSLGVTFYELLTGLPPFPEGKTPAVLQALQASGPAPPVRRRRPDVPKGVEAVVAKLLEYDPARRYASAGEARHALAGACPLPDPLPVRIFQDGREVYRGRLARGQQLVLGRASDAGVCLEGRGLSRFHAKLSLSPEGLFVTDLDSTNGTFLAGRRVRRPARVRLRDRLRLGKHVGLELRLG
ncbi:MAG: FHA domain-containing protein [Planctomycetota bacterium]|nr:MAG: FHA domain-containing protein [Planctomycetota bacterium]